MGLQKYRADYTKDAYPNGAIPHYCNWVGGPTLAKLERCPTGQGLRMVYITGEADTFFSLPAACKVKGKTVRGFVTFSEVGPFFHSNKNK